MPKRTWAPNPYAIAERLLGRNVDVGDWASARAVLEEAFKIKRELLFDPDGHEAPRFDLFQAIADLVDKPVTAEAAFNLPLVRRARALYGDEPVRRVLPFLIPLADARFRPPGDASPGGQFVGDYRPLDRFMVDGASFLDPIQGDVADCYLISSMISLAWLQSAPWKDFIGGAGGAGQGFRFSFFKPDASRAPQFDAPGDVPFDDKGRPCFARGSDPQEGWPSMVEKAFVMQQSGHTGADPSPADYQQIGVQKIDPQDACQMLVGGTADHLRNLELVADPQWHRLSDRCDARRIVRFPSMAWTWDDASHLPRVTVPGGTEKQLTFGNTGLIPNHAYAVLGLSQRNGHDFVVVRNPHGVSMTGPDQPPEFATGTWKPDPGDASAPVVELNQLGVFGMPIEWFNACFQAIGWVIP